MPIRNRLLVAACTAVSLGFLGLDHSTTTSLPSNHIQQVLPCDVAMSGATFFFEGDTNENGYPANGTPFVIQGYIYPAGTFARHGALSGTLANGDPEFPKDVLGTWTCRGWHLQDGDAQTGVVVATNQVFEFDAAIPGDQTIVTDGIELADFDLPFRRTITGGTGKFAGASGQMEQVYVGNGLNKSGGFNTTFRITPDRR